MSWVVFSVFRITSFRPAPMARTSQAWPCLRCWSQLAGGTPPGPPGTHVQSQLWYSCLIPVLVHTSYLSSGTHLSSQFWCTPLTQIINVTLRPALIPQDSLHSAMPCQGQAPGPPSMHVQFQFWYTCLFSLLLLMFYLSYQTYTLACTNGMALAVLGQLARGKPLGPPSPHV